MKQFIKVKNTKSEDGRPWSKLGGDGSYISIKLGILTLIWFLLVCSAAIWIRTVF